MISKDLLWAIWTNHPVTISIRARKQSPSVRTMSSKNIKLNSKLERMLLNHNFTACKLRNSFRTIIGCSPLADPESCWVCFHDNRVLACPLVIPPIESPSEALKRGRAVSTYRRLRVTPNLFRLLETWLMHRLNCIAHPIFGTELWSLLPSFRHFLTSSRCPLLKLSGSIVRIKPWPSLKSKGQRRGPLTLQTPLVHQNVT